MSLSHSPLIVRDGLVLCLDAANPRRYHKSGTTGSELKVSNNGTVINMDAAKFDSANGGSLGVDGTDERVNLGNAFSPSAGLSISVWVFFDQFAYGSTIRAITEKGYDGSIEPFGLYLSGGLLQAFYYDGGVNGTSINVSLLSTLAWYNVISTFDGSAWKIYIDGVLVSSSSNSTQIQSNTQDILIGAATINGTVSRFFDGKISNLSIYNRALSADEVLQNYLATRGRYK